MLRALEPFVRRGPSGRGGARCELCGTPLEAAHAHLADVERRVLACACRACGLLFAREGAGDGRWRTVPDRHLHDPSFVLTEAQWRALGIPVSMAFFFESSAAKQWIAVYPSPAGPVEAALAEDEWRAIVRDAPIARGVERDVEALLASARGDGLYDCMLVPIHACYVLVGRVRRLWRGLDGGDEARAAIADELAALRARCSPPEDAS